MAGPAGELTAGAAGRAVASTATPMVVALAGGLAGAALGAMLGDAFFAGEAAVLAACMTAIAWEDACRFKVPDMWSLAAALAGLAAAGLGAAAGAGSVPGAGGAAATSGPAAAVGLALLQALLCGGAFLLVREIYFRLRGAEGLGFGDVKLAAASGIWLGWQLFAVAVMLAAIGALVFVMAHTATGRAWPRERKIPLAAFMAPAVWLCWWGAGWHAAW